MTREDWIESFVAYVAAQMPQAPRAYLSTKAEKLYAHLGSEYDPVEVAEVAWAEFDQPGG